MACKVAVTDVVTVFGWIVLGVHTLAFILMLAYGKIQKKAAQYLESGMSKEALRERHKERRKGKRRHALAACI